jgi:alpha-galactosidase
MALLVELGGHTLALRHDGPSEPRSADGGVLLPAGRSPCCTASGTA